MFLNLWTNKSTQTYLDKIEKLKEKLRDCDAIVIGAGAGLSAAAGFEYSGKRFDTYFADFKQKYKIQDMYSGGFYPFESLEEYWAYWSRYIWINRYMDAEIDVYHSLFSLVKDKDYFVLTTNVDHCFQKAGFDKKRLFYTQGDFGLFQCMTPCHNETYKNKDLILEMVSKQKDIKIPTELIPKCPHCGKPMTMNLRCDNTFVEDEVWHQASQRYADFIRTRKNLNIVFLELGVGYNTPAIIKYPFMQMTMHNPNATYVCINQQDILCPKEIQSQSICIQEDIYKVLQDLK